MPRLPQEIIIFYYHSLKLSKKPISGQRQVNRMKSVEINVFPIPNFIGKNERKTKKQLLQKMFLVVFAH